MMEIKHLPVEVIKYRADARHRSDDAVADLADSIDSVGLINPIRVRAVGDVYEVVTGAHRLQALDLLGWREIPCIIASDDDLAARMAMIAENLHRAELSALERDEQVALWVKLNAEKVSQLATPGAEQPTFKGVRAAERELGIKRDDASRAVKVAALSDEAKAAAREAGLDNNRSALLAAARHSDPQEQVAVLQQRKTGGIAARFAPVEAAPAPETPTKVFERFVALVDEIEALPIPELLHAAGRQRSVLGQRASGLADRMSRIMEALD
ncbi:ParB/RepB/Spo0J family partition protein [Mesorhizobium sp. PUT5]|uniref:ParB/RepB/Spo0J family partition protein n=1 Tax=Mesorhizobium sp. PUT5 TaxID=3454629 RepID=UPI003FA41780